MYHSWKRSMLSNSLSAAIPAQLSRQASTIRPQYATWRTRKCATWPMCAHPAHRHTSLKERQGKEIVRKVQDRMTTEGHSLRCPFCEVGRLESVGNKSARCTSCRAAVSGPVLGTLIWITQLPDAIGRHACECGHPEMRLLPDGVYRCPACASEVVPISRAS